MSALKDIFLNYALFHYNNNTHLQKPDIPGIGKFCIIIKMMKITEQRLFITGLSNALTYF